MSDHVFEPLGRIVDFRKGTKTTVFESERPGTAPYLGAASLEDPEPKLFASTFGAVIAERSDLLMLWDGERSGLVSGGLEGVVSSTVARLRPTKGVDSNYLRHYLQHNFNWIQARRTGTGVPHVPKDLSSWMVVRIPSLNRQRRIAEILNTLDDQIDATERMIAKLQLARRGLLIDLLTYGMDAGPKYQEPAADGNSFLDSSHRPLPKGWQTKPLGELLAAVDPAMRSGPFGSALLKHELTSSGIPILGIDNVHVDRFVTNYSRFVAPSKAQELARYRVRPFDVMITIMGTVGRSCLVPGDIGEALSSKHVWTISVDQERYVPYLLSLQLNHAPWARAHLRKDEQGGIMSAIRSDTIRSLLLPVPPIEEQREIATVLSESERRISTETSELAKLKLVKSGIVDDLMSVAGPLTLEAAS